MVQHNEQRSYTISEDTLSEAADLLEAIANLNFLACVDAHKPSGVERWTSENTHLIKKMGMVFQKIASNKQS